MVIHLSNSWWNWTCNCSNRWVQGEWDFCNDRKKQILTFDGSTLAVTGDTTISGNLTVQGNAQRQSSEIATEDPIIALNTAIGSGVANTYDSGCNRKRF